MTQRLPNELEVPKKAQESLAAIELLRVWVAGGAQHVALATEVWNDPGAWGIVLVDLAKHVANSYEVTGHYSKESALARIKEVFDVEWSSPTSDAKGELSGR